MRITVYGKDGTMTCNPTKSPLLFSFLFSCLTLLFASCFPFWTGVGYKDTGKFHLATLWDTFADISESERREKSGRNPHPCVREVSRENNRTTVMVLVIGATIGAVAGRLIYWLKWERASPTTTA
jgi:hypothetical protein